MSFDIAGKSLDCNKLQLKQKMQFFLRIPMIIIRFAENASLTMTWNEWK